MNTTRLHTKRLVKVLVFTLAACSPASRLTGNEANPPFEVKKISPSRFDASQSSGRDEALIEACTKWQLTKEQAQRFFQLSKSYQENPYNEFNQLPCSIEGVVEAEGKTWEFTINAAATAFWQHGEEVRYFGCSAPACQPLVLMMPDQM